MTAWRGVALLTLLASCGHSEPFVTADTRTNDPFATATPVLLTYSPLTDIDPAFSEDGTRLVYTHERPGNADRCVGVLPVAGGTRTADLCPGPPATGLSKTGFSQGALRADGMMLFSKHYGQVGRMTSDSMGLWLGPADSVAKAIRVMPLGAIPVGARGRWDDLLGAVWLGPDEVLALATQRFLVNVPCNRLFGAYCPLDDERTFDRDTLELGVEIVRLRLATDGVALLQSIAATEAIDWAFDASASRAYYIAQRADPVDVDVYHESIADTLFAVDLTGGAPVVRYGTRGGRNTPMLRLHGVAAGGGRVFVSRSWHEPNLVDNSGRYPRGRALQSDITEILPDGSLRTIVPQLGWHWGRIRLSPDGHHLVAEALDRTTSDLYLIEVGS